MKDNYTDKDTSEFAYGDLMIKMPAELLVSLHKVWIDCAPDLFHIIFWWDESRTEKRGFYYQTEGDDESDFLFKSYAYIVENVPFENYREFETNPNGLNLAFQPEPFHQCGFLSHSDPSGLNISLTLGFRQKSAVTEGFTAQVMNLVICFLKNRTDATAFKPTPLIRTAEIDTLSTEYLRSMEEISARFTRALKKQIITERIEHDSGLLALKRGPGEHSELEGISDGFETQNEREVLLSLSHDLALIRTPLELTEIINIRLKQLFKINNYIIFTFDNQARKWNHFVKDPDHHPNNSAAPKGYWDRNYGFNDVLLNEVSHADTHHIYDLDMLKAWNVLPQDIAHWKTMGIDKVIGFPLRIRSESVGVIFMHMQPGALVELINYRLLKDFVSQIAVAIMAIKIHYELAAKENEKSGLLTFNERMAPVKKRDDLSLIIKQYLISIFNIKTFIIALIDPDGRTYSYFQHGHEHDEGNSFGMGFKKYAYEPGKGSVIEKIMMAETPLLFKVEQLTFSEDFWRNAGITKVRGARLTSSGKNVGIIWLDAALISERLIQGLCSQLGIALSRVIDHEQQTEKEIANEALLSLNIALATVKNSEDLQRIINSRLKHFLNCSHAVIGRINEDKVSAVAYVTDPESKSKVHPDYKKVISQHFLINDALMSRAAVSSSPVSLNLQKICDGDEVPLYAAINHQNGLNGMVITRLLSDKELFGFWMIFFEQSEIPKDKLTIIESLANQISIAISRILATEEIRKREEEKSRLLEFSREIASLRDKAGLSKILKDQLTKLFGIDDFIIFSLNTNAQTYRPLLYQTNHDIAREKEFEKFLTTDGNLNDGIFNLALSADKPLVHNMQEVAKWENPPAYIGIAEAVNLKNMVTVSLKIGQDNIALLVFHLMENNSDRIFGNMFKSICSLLAIAVENIIANEKVNLQLLEINDYKQQLEDERIYLREELQTNQNYGEIIGTSMQMQETFHLISQVAPSDSTVLILGETGTGKELIARAIHNNSTRVNKLMVKVNCAALPANLIESELFGHERGSFTGATDRRIGKFELAHNGTLFLDEIGEMPVELQVKILRALQEKEIERIGGKGVIKVNVRVIAATNRDLEQEMEEGRFRRDLYYRLNIFPIQLSPLRERKEDIPMLARHFINRYSKKTGKKIIGLSAKVLQELTRYSWPGNIRELEHLLERSVLLARGDTLKQVDLPKERTTEEGKSYHSGVNIKTIDENEREHILQILKYCNGKVAGPDGAASLLGVPPSTLNSKFKKLGIRREYLG